MTDDNYWRYLPRNRNLPRLMTIWQRDHGLCQICYEGCAFDDATRDHITPYAMGGGNALENLRLTHSWCNNNRQDRELDPHQMMIAYARVRGRMDDPTAEQVYGYEIETDETR